MRYQRISQLEGRLKVSRHFLQSLQPGDHVIGGRQVTVQKQEQNLTVIAVNDGGRVFACGFR